MTEPSYYPLDVLESPRESVLPPSPDPPAEEKYKDVPDQPEPNSADAAGVHHHERSRSSMYLTPLRPQLFHRSPVDTRPPLWRVIRTPVKMALFPLAAIGYLAFCYAVHGKVIPVKTYGLYAVTPQHLATIKGGITSISIIIISIALYPIYDVVSNMQSEEFFRVLASHNHGVPLDTVNHISTPSFGNIDTMLAIWRHGCSNYYILGMVAMFLAWLVATLAPGALSVGSVLADGDMVALAIGGVFAQSVLNGSVLAPQAFYASSNSDKAASITWAEMELNVQYSFGVANTSEPDYAAYIAPLPIDLATATSARWLTDVIGINPQCSWATTNLTQTVQLPLNESGVGFDSLTTAYLVDFDLDVQVTGTDFGIGDPVVATVKDPTMYVTNHTTHVIPSDGSTVILLGQCMSGCLPYGSINIDVNMGGLPTFTIAFTDQTWTMAVLACLPNITIETREVRNDGQGVLSVQPRSVGTQLTPQRNLHPVQTLALFSIATMSITQNAGPTTGNSAAPASLGSEVQGDLLFGQQQFDALPGLDAPYGTSVTLNLAPIEDITSVYTQIIRSAAKSYLSGYLGTAYVPGRISTTEIIFVASIPNVVVATAVFALLAALFIIAYFRPGKGVDFTLVNVVAAVHGSELPAQFSQMKAEQASILYADSETRGDGDRDSEGGIAGMDDAPHAGKGPGRRWYFGTADQNDITEMLSDRRIFMQRRVDGSPVLHIS